MVLVHGWRGDKAPWTSAETSVFWPEKLLAAKVPEARILSYEYDVELESFWNEEDLITELSTDLIDGLMEERPEKAEKRAVLFVAHCLGGLVCENVSMLHLIHISGTPANPEILYLYRLLW
jgi:hypothetical protein